MSAFTTNLSVCGRVHLTVFGVTVSVQPCNQNTHADAYTITAILTNSEDGNRPVVVAEFLIEDCPSAPVKGDWWTISGAKYQVVSDAVTPRAGQIGVPITGMVAVNLRRLKADA